METEKKPERYREEKGIRENAVRSKVRVRERGRDGPQECTGSRGTAPSATDGPWPLRASRRDGGVGRSVQPHTQGRGTQRKMAQSWEGAGLLSP